MFIPRRDSAKQIPKEVELFLLMPYFALGNVHWTFNLWAVSFLYENLKIFYPPKGLCKSRFPIGSIWQSFHFIVFEKPFWHFENPHSQSAFLKSWKWFIYGCMGWMDGISKVSIKFLFTYTLFRVGKVYWRFVSVAVIHRFEILEILYPPKGTLRMQNPMESIWQSFHFIVFEKRFWNFQNPHSPSAFFKILKMFYPPKGLCEAEPNGVHLAVFPFYCVWERVFGPFISLAVIRLFKIFQMF